MQYPSPLNLSSDIPREKVTDHCKMDVKQRHDRSDGVSFITPRWGRISCAWVWCCFCDSKIARTLQMLQRFYWWVGLGQSVRWWIRRCLFCQARKTSRQAIRWPTTLMPLPSGPGQIVSVDYFGPLPITRNGNKHILLYTDRFSRHIAAYAVTQDERTAEGTARIFVEQYNPQATVGQGVSEDNSLLVTKLSLNWTGPYKILVVGPGLGPDGRPVADKTLYMDLPTDVPGKDQKKPVSVDRCKMCHNPSDDSDIPKYLPAGLSKYVLHSFTDKPPPFHPTTEDVVKSGIPVDIEKITGHQLVRGRGGKLAVMNETHREKSSRLVVGTGEGMGPRCL